MAGNIAYDFIIRDKGSKTLTKIRGESIKTSKSFGAMRVGISGSLGAGVKALGGLGVALGAVGIAAGTMGIKTAANLEQAQISFTALLHSGTKAKKFLTELKDFAAKTPFELQGVEDAARQLIGAGEAAKDTIPTLTAWGDASGALGLSQDKFGTIMTAVTQIMNKGKVSSEELMQITEAGIPVFPLLAKALGKPIPKLQELIKKGKLTAKDVLPALEKQMGKDYGGSMAKQSQTLTGIWSTLMDTINLGLADTLQPLIPTIKDGVTGAIGILGKAFKGLTAVGKEVGPLFKNAKVYIDAFITGLKGGQSFGSGPFADLVNTGKQVRDIFDQLMNRLKLLWKIFQPVFAQLPGLFKASLPAIKQLWDVIQNGVDTVIRVVGPIIRDLALTLISTFKEALPQIKSSLKSIGEIITNTMAIIKIVWARLKPFVLPMVKLVFGTAFKIIAAALKIISATIKLVLDIIHGNWHDAWKQIKVILSTALGLIKTIITAAMKFIRLEIQGAWSLIKGIFGKAATAVWHAVRDAFIKMKTAAVEKFSSFITWVGSIPGKIKDKLSSANKWLYDKGKQVLQGFWDGALNIWHKLTGWVSGIAKWIKDHKGPVSMDGKLLHPAGKALMHGLLSGLKFGFKSVGNFVYHVGDTVQGTIGSLLTGAGSGIKLTGNAKRNQLIAASLLSSFGWNGTQMGPLTSLWMGESGWNQFAKNKSSGAYGIPQALPASKMASAGGDWMTNPKTQIYWGLNYIKQRYGSPLNALLSWQDRKPHWYGKGGVINEPVLGMGMRSGRSYGFGENGPETVIPGTGHGGGNVIINVNGSGDPQAVARKVAAEMVKLQKRGYKLGF